MFLKYPVGMDLIAGLRDFPRQLKVPTLDWAVSAHLQCSETWFTSVRVRPCTTGQRRGNECKTHQVRSEGPWCIDFARESHKR